jgi:hypothetical protein
LQYNLQTTTFGIANSKHTTHLLTAVVELAIIPFANNNIWYFDFKTNDKHMCNIVILNLQYHLQSTTFGIANSKHTQTCMLTSVFQFAIPLANNYIGIANSKTTNVRQHIFVEFAIPFANSPPTNKHTFAAVFN